MRPPWFCFLPLFLFACESNGSDGKDLVDTDGDGFPEDIDCDDADATVYPDADERCDGLDNNCNGEIDERPVDGFTYYEDTDADGHGGLGSVSACTAPSGYVDNSEDCDDSNAAMHPGAQEVCDGLDNDCNDLIDDDAADFSTYYADLDGDGYGDPETPLEACSPPSSYVSDNTDCDDSNTDLTPDTRWHQDSDGDGFGAPAVFVSGCEVPKGHVSDSTDCDDDSDRTYPGAAEESKKQCMRDVDDDGFGDSTPPTGVDPGTDCDDERRDTNPEADEYCDAIDHDCSGFTDDSYALDASAWYTDSDTDGYGDAKGTITMACELPEGCVANNDDCDDSTDTVSPDAIEDCTDEVDNDCDGDVDESCIYYTTDSADITITGSTRSEYSGSSFTTGDVNGDTYEDLIIGSHAASSGYGRTSVFLGPLTAGDYTLASDEDLTFTGNDSSSYAGWTVDSGDLDGDGYDDMLIAAYSDSYVTSNGGSVYIIYGPQTAGSLGPSDADAVVYGKSANDNLGYQNMSVYDIDGDGDDDALIGAYSYEDTGLFSSGVIGIFDAPSSTIQIDDGDIVLLGGDSYDQVGYSIGSVGDLDSDGSADIGWGEPGESAAYLMYGPVSAGTYTSADADITIQGASSSTTSSGGYNAGSEMNAGDFNGDGYVDTVVGAMSDYITASYQGSVALFYGPLSGTLSYADDHDFRFYDDNTLTYLSSPYYGTVQVGDLDDDGMDDLFVTNSYNENLASYGGAGFILYGPMTGELTTEGYDAAIYGGSYSLLGHHSGLLGDVDGNGSLDVVIASYCNAGYAGETYVFFNERF